MQGWHGCNASFFSACTWSGRELAACFTSAHTWPSLRLRHWCLENPRNCLSPVRGPGPAAGVPAERGVGPGHAPLLDGSPDGCGGCLGLWTGFAFFFTLNLCFSYVVHLVTTYDLLTGHIA